MDPAKIIELAASLGVSADDKEGLVSFVLGYAQASKQASGGAAAAAAPSNPVQVFYWPFHGRAGAALRMLAQANIPFEQHSDFPKLMGKCALLGGKATNGIMAPPIVVDGETVVSQSVSIARYIGHKYGFPAPSDAIGFQMAMNIVDAIEVELARNVKSSKTLREYLVDGVGGKPPRFKTFFGTIEEAVVGPYLFGDKPSWVDFLLTQLLAFSDFTLFTPLKEHTGVDALADFPKVLNIYKTLDSLESKEKIGTPVAGVSFKKTPEDEVLKYFNKPEVLIIGASGSTGTALAKALTAKGVKVTAGVRNPDPESPKNAGLKSAGVTFVAADMGKPETLEAAIKAGTVVAVIAPGTLNRAELAINAINAAAKNGAAHIALLSVASAGATGVFAEQFREIENAVAASGTDFTAFRFPFFLDNVLGQPIKDASAIFAPVGGDIETDLIAVDDLGEAMAAGIINRGEYRNAILRVGGTRTTQNAVAAAYAKALGKEVKFTQVTPEAALESMTGQGWPEWQAKGCIELFDLQVKKSHAMRNPDGVDKTKELLGRDPVSVETFAEATKGVFA